MQCSDILLTEECLWCNHTSWMREQIDTLIQLMESSLVKQPEWFQRMCKDLSCCSACVDQYHNAMKAHLCGSKNAIVYNWNCRRIVNCFEERLQDFDNDDFYEQSITLETAIKEVLKYPRFMLNEQVCAFCLKSLKLLLKQNKSFELHERLQGLCLLLVNQDSQVSLWALKTFKSFGSVDCDEYAELENVIDWLLDVINFNLFINYIDIDNSANWDDSQKVILPRHLFTSKPREFWLGICTILTVMTKSCIQTCLLPSDLSRKELLESVLAYLNKDSDKEYGIPTFYSQQESYKCKNTIFWPVLQCFVLLVDKLGSHFWMITTTTPNSVLKLIKCNPYYQLQLKICYSQAARLDLATNNDSDFSFSQLVYDDSFSRVSTPMEPLQERYHGFSLSWVVPFIKSLIDFGDCESSTIVELLDFACHIHSVSLHGDTNVSSTDLFQTVLPIEMVAKRVEDLFLPQESLKYISQSVDVLFSQKVYSVLLRCKQAIFCMITVLCSYVLSSDRLVLSRNKQHLSQTARTYTSLVMYCSNEKTASKLWYLVKQISSLSPFLSVVSNQVGNSHDHTDLLQPDELSKTLLKLIADKQNNQDIAGPFLYPPSFNNSTSKKRTSSVVKIKQESETNSKSFCTTETNQEFKPLLDHHLYHQEPSSHYEGSTYTDKTTDSDTSGGSNLKQISLTLTKLPITVLKSDKGILHYEHNNSAEVLSRSESKTLTEPIESHIESDTESCSSNSDDDLPRYPPRRITSTDASTSSTVTIKSELNEQLVMQKGSAKEGLVKNVQLMSQSAQFKKRDDNIKSESDTKDKSFSIMHSDKLKIEGSVERDKETIIIVDNEQNSDCAIVDSSSIVDMVLPECNLHLSKGSVSEDSVVVDQCVSKLSTLIEQRESIGSEVSSVENVNLDSGDEDVFSAVEHTSESTSLEEQQQLNSNTNMRLSETVNVEQMQCENAESRESFTDKEANFVVVPNKQCNLKFKSKAMESATTSNEVINSDALSSRVSSFQQPSTKQLDKIQPAVPGRAPFSKSRMASLHSSSSVNASTKVQASKAKNNATSKDLHKPVTQSNTTETVKVMVKIETSRVYSKEEFLLEVLSWNPTSFFQTKGRAINEGPYSLPNIAKVPITFKSSDQYIDVFKPLLLLETWDTIKEEMKYAREQERMFYARIDDCNLSSATDVVSAHHRLTCKGIIAKNDSHPTGRDLVCIKCIPHGTNDTSLDFPVMFGIVESISKRTSAEVVGQSSEVSTAKELTLHLAINRCNGNFHFLSDNLDIEILTVVSMSSFVRQWEGLIAVSRNMLCRDVLHPRHTKYFGYFDDIEPIAKDREYQLDEFSFNASQFQAITLTTKALCLSYCIPQIVLLQGPPGTGKTHTIIGIITSFFTNQKLNASMHSNALPGNRLKPPKPHLLVCAPSNAGIDVVVNRLMMKGLIVGTESWKKRCERMKKQDIGTSTYSDGFRVLRIGVPDKIDPKIFPIFLDEVVKKKSTEVSKKVQTLKDEIARVDNKIAKLVEQITFAQKRIVSLKCSNKEDQLYCKELNANINDLSIKTKQLRTERLKLTRETTICLNDIKMIQQKVLMEADIICCTLTSSGSQKLRECFQSKPQHFTAVIVDEAAQCSELLTLIPLLYHSTKLVLVGDPAQLPSTVKSMKAEKFGYGQSLFERLFYYFNHENYDSNPAMMLQMQYRMNSKICQFPSEQFYHSKLITHSSCDKEILLNPLLVFDLHDGAEHIKDGFSYTNELECQLIIKICNTLLEVTTSSNIGIITPYKAQTKMIQMYIKSRRYHDIEIGTVDSFQGREKDIILLSCVRVQPGGSIGFLTDHRRLNVAITRAKKALYIIGHLRTFQFNKYWSNLIDHAEKENVIVRVDENMSCARKCLKVNSSVGITENQVYTKGQAKHGDREVQLALPGSSHNTVTEQSSDVLLTEKHSMVDRSAFILPRKSIKYIDNLPKSKAETSKNYSPSKNTSTTGKQKRSSSELRHKDHEPSPKKVLVPPTDDKHRNLSSSSGKHTKPNNQTASSANCRTELAKHTSQMTIQTTDTRLSTTAAHSSTMASSTSKSNSSASHKIPSNISVSSVPSNAVNSRSFVNTHDSSDNRTDTWGGQRKRTSHFTTNMSTEQQVKRKRRYSDDTGSKKAKLN